VEFGIGLPTGGGRWDRMVDEATRAEAAGLDAVWINDHLFAPMGAERPQFEAWTALAAIAAVTERVRLGHLVACVSFRNVGLFAKSAVTADHVSDGRLEIGLGAGWFEAEYTSFGYEFPTPADRVDAADEYIEALDLLLTAGDDPVDYDGRFVTLAGARCLPGPIQQPRPPIVVGTAGRRMLGITGRRADTWNCPASAIPTLEATRDRVMAAGRPVRTTLQMPAAPGRDPAEAAAHLERAKRDLAWTGDVAEIGLVGTVEQAAERALAYRDRGVDGFTCVLPGGDARIPSLEALGAVAGLVRAS